LISTWIIRDTNMNISHEWRSGSSARSSAKSKSSGEAAGSCVGAVVTGVVKKHALQEGSEVLGRPGKKACAAHRSNKGSHRRRTKSNTPKVTGNNKPRRERKTAGEIE